MQGIQSAAKDGGWGISSGEVGGTRSQADIQTIGKCRKEKSQKQSLLSNLYLHASCSMWVTYFTNNLIIRYKTD